MKFLVVFLDGVEHKSREIDAYDVIEAAQSVRDEFPGVKIESVTPIGETEVPGYGG